MKPEHRGVSWASRKKNNSATHSAVNLVTSTGNAHTNKGLHAKETFSTNIQNTYMKQIKIG